MCFFVRANKILILKYSVLISNFILKKKELFTLPYEFLNQHIDKGDAADL